VKNAPTTQRYKNSKERRFTQESFYGNLLLFLRKETRELGDSAVCGVLKKKLLCSCLHVVVVVVVVIVVAVAVIVVQNTKLHNENFHNYYS
jgi:hypothetical protein